MGIPWGSVGNHCKPMEIRMAESQRKRESPTLYHSIWGLSTGYEGFRYSRLQYNRRGPKFLPF